MGKGENMVRRGRPSELDDPEMKKTTVQMLASGRSQMDVSRELGIPRSSISRFKSREDIQELIRFEAAKYFEALPDSIEMSQNLIRAGCAESAKLVADKPADGSPVAVDYKLIEMSQREVESIRKASGIQPTNVTNNVFNTVLVGTGEVLSPAIHALLDAHLALSDCTTDVEPEVQPTDQEPGEPE